MKVALLATILFAFPFAASAQTKVYLADLADDSIGNQLAYQLRENLRASRGLKLVASKDDAAIVIRMVTLDPGKDGYQTVYSAVWTMRDPTAKSLSFYLTNNVGICGGNRVKNCADDLVAVTDRVATDVQQAVRGR